VPSRATLYAALVLLTLAIRVAYIADRQPFREPQGDEMERAARSVATYGVIGHVFDPDWSTPAQPSAHVAPLYPMLIGSVFYLFGWDTLAGRAAQEGLSLLATVVMLVLLPRIAERLHLHVAAGWIAAFTLALLPVNIWLEATGAWEQPYAALALLAILLLFCRASDEAWESRQTGVFLGLAVGITALLSPQIVPAAMLMFAAEFLVRRGLRRRIATAGIILALVAGAVITPWVIRNWIELGGFVPVRSNFGLEWRMGNNPYANGITFGTTLKDAHNMYHRYHPYTNAQERDRLLQIGELAYMHEKQQQAWQWIGEHPFRTMALTARRFLLYWFPPPVLWDPDSPVAVLKSLAVCGSLVATIVCLGWLWSMGHDRAYLIAAALIGPSLPYMITHVDIRYRYPNTAVSAILAAHLCVVMWRARYHVLARPT